MSLFRTEISPDKPNFNIDHNTPVFFMGSCFSNNIGEKMQERAFDALVNPFGVLYNPISIHKGLGIVLSDKVYSEKDLFYYSGLWGSFNHYTLFSSSNKTTCLNKINKNLDLARQQLSKTKVMVITLGTSWAFKNIENKTFVANCHKFPAKYFTREFISQHTVIELFEEIIQKLVMAIPDLKIIFTVSPIRHVKDGPIGNQVSKANLILAVNQLVKAFDCCYYFPSYEIMMDDLRDYRFYAKDMIHPSEAAIDYIWGKFEECLMSSHTINLSKQIFKLKQAANHRPLNMEGDAYMKFLDDQMEKANQLEINEDIDLSTIKKQFSKPYNKD